MASVEFRAAEKVYSNGFKAIPGMDLEIQDHEFVVLVGPSGCGKSTLLRMVAGLETVTGGAIHIGEREVSGLEPSARDIAMVFQNYALYPHMTVRGNMAYGLKNRGTPRDEIERRVAEAARILELTEFLDRKPRQLSGGQRQRVAMGRAIVREPAVFLFDEPLSNLDAKLRVQMRVEIKKLQRTLGTTSIYVTHDQVEAMTMADRLVVMNAGIAEQIGTPMDVYERPATHFVASFIGSPAMNLLPGTLAAGGRRLTLDDGAELDLGDAAHAQTAARRVSVGLRPEHLIIGADGWLEIAVDLAEPLGAETLVHGTLAGGSQGITVRLQDNQPVEMGTNVRLGIDPARVHLFDESEGTRI